MIKWRKESILDIYNLVLGTFLFVSPWLAASTHGSMGKDAWVSSALIVLFSIASLIAFSEWEEWGIVILGLWLILSPWALGFQNAAAMKINVGIGIFVTYLAAIELFLIHFSSPPETHSR
jgi:SPW repeat